jgi:transcriptional regulator with XRE-family HTH domain
MTATLIRRRRVNRYALKALRTTSKLTQEALATRVGLDQAAISRLENGSVHSCTPEVFEGLGEALNVPVIALYLVD